MDTAVIPLAITMMAGPGIMAAIILVTHERAIAVSVAYLLGVAVAVVAFTAAWYGIASLLGDNVSLGDPDDKGSTGKIIQYALVALLLLAILRNYLNRETVQPPKWLGALLSVTPAKALRTGLLIIPLMPSDEVIMATVGVNLVHSSSSFLDAVPFMALTVAVASLPLLGVLLFRHRAERTMPAVREWMTDNSWALNIAVCVIFILLIVS